MSIEVPAEVVDEFTGGVLRNFDAFSSQTWVEAATGTIRSYGNQAAAQLVPGEQVEWVTAGVVHRYGKVWPNAILVVTPDRLILSASRRSLRTKHDLSSLHRGPESLLSTARRPLPGSSQDLWMLELASEHGPLVFAFPDFNRAAELAELTAAFIARRATCVQETGQILLDGAPYKPFGDFVDPFEARPPAVAAAQPEDDQHVTMTMPAALPDLSGAPATQVPPVALAEQPAPAQTHDAPALPPADWYDDPISEARLRYWDGSAWTLSVVG